MTDSVKAFVPHPADTSDIQLPEDLLQLTDEMARNVHDVWAAERIAEGWRYGPRRDDQRKETPELVPYDQLAEGEKEYDRHTAIQTLKLILLLGYKIER